MIHEHNYPLVSIIVPVYNMEDFVIECLSSIKESTYENIEVLIIDDGSKDNSLKLIQQFAKNDSRFHVYFQENAGVCKARNKALELSKGKYILPIDSDDILCKDFIQESVSRIEENKNIKAVLPTIEFFGDKTGIWSLPDFKLSLLARKNTIPISGLYRKEDAIKIGGYCEDLTAREDWVFWIGMLKDGGDVVRLHKTGLKYRIRSTSKRIQDRQYKRKVIDLLNSKYPEFFQTQLGGPLRYHRTWSKLINKILGKRYNPFL